MTKVVAPPRKSLVRYSASRTLFLAFVAIAVVSALIWGLGLNFWIPLGLAAWTAIDIVLTHRKERRNVPSRPTTDVDRTTSIGGTVNPGEFVEYRWRGEKECFGTSMALGSGTVFIDLRRDKLLELRKQAAIQLVAEADTLNTRFLSFKGEQAKAQSRWADDILQLEISLIGLYSESDPGSGEVYFTEKSGGDAWYCVLEKGQFADLRIEQ